MRILLDESVPRRLGTFLTGHEATTVVKRGWAGIRNGRLLALAAAEFDVPSLRTKTSNFSDAARADVAMQSSGVGHAMNDVHAYVLAKARGERAKRPKPI